MNGLSAEGSKANVKNAFASRSSPYKNIVISLFFSFIIVQIFSNISTVLYPHSVMICGLESVAVGFLFKAYYFLCLRVLGLPSSIVRLTHLFTCCPPAMASCPPVWGCSRGLPGGCSIITAAPTTHHPWLLNAQALLSQYQRGPALLCTVTSPALQWRKCSLLFSAALSSALMDQAMQSDQGSAQTPATADHRRTSRSSTLSSLWGL